MLSGAVWQPVSRRFVIIGMAETQILLFVAYAERDERIRIVSAGRVIHHEEEDYFNQDA